MTMIWWNADASEHLSKFTPTSTKWYQLKMMNKRSIMSCTKEQAWYRANAYKKSPPAAPVRSEIWTMIVMKTTEYKIITNILFRLAWCKKHYFKTVYQRYGHFAADMILAMSVTKAKIITPFACDMRQHKDAARQIIYIYKSAEWHRHSLPRRHNKFRYVRHEILWRLSLLILEIILYWLWITLSQERPLCHRKWRHRAKYVICEKCYISNSRRLFVIFITSPRRQQMPQLSSCFTKQYALSCYRQKIFYLWHAHRRSTIEPK